MTEITDIYRCNICGNTIEIIKGGSGELVCCAMPMELLKSKSKEEGNEAHLPVLEKRGDKTFVKVGKNMHPSEQNHYIEFIEILSKDKQYIKRKYLKPGEVPELEMKPMYKDILCRSLCNVHGLWSTHF